MVIEFNCTHLYISETAQDADIDNRMLIGTYTRSTQRCHCEWPWVV